MIIMIIMIMSHVPLHICTVYWCTKALILSKDTSRVLNYCLLSKYIPYIPYIHTMATTLHCQWDRLHSW